MNRCINKALFPLEDKMFENGLISPTQLELMSFAIPSSVKRSGGQSTRSRRLRLGSLGGCPNSMALEGLLHIEGNEHCYTVMNATKAQEQCINLEVMLNKIVNNLQ